MNLDSSSGGIYNPPLTSWTDSGSGCNSTSNAKTYQPRTTYTTSSSTDTYTFDVVPKQTSGLSIRGSSSKDGHTVRANISITDQGLFVEYTCDHCNVVLHTETISRIPRRVRKSKCLPRIIEGV